MVAIVTAVLAIGSIGAAAWWFTRPDPFGPILTNAQFDSLVESREVTEAVGVSGSPTEFETPSDWGIEPPECLPFYEWTKANTTRIVEIAADNIAGEIYLYLSRSSGSESKAQLISCAEARGYERIAAQLDAETWYLPAKDGSTDRTNLSYGNVRILFQGMGRISDSALREVMAAIDQAASTQNPE